MVNKKTNKLKTRTRWSQTQIVYDQSLISSSTNKVSSFIDKKGNAAHISLLKHKQHYKAFQQLH